MARRGTAGLKGLWAKARETTKDERGGDFIPVDVGSYVMQIVDASLGEWGGARKIWLKWCVISGADESDIGAICNEWLQIDTEEKMKWVQRELIALGVDVDEVEIETDEDLLGVFKGLIDERAAARVRVTEKDGYSNMRVQKAVEVDEDDLVDPVEVLNTRAGSTDDDEEDELKVGDRVEIEVKGKKVTGEVAGFTNDDDVEVSVEGKKKPIVVALDDVTRLDEEDEEDEDEEDEDDDSDEDDEDDEDEDDEVEIEVGDEVIVSVGGKDKRGVVKKDLGDGKYRVKVGKKTVDVDAGDISFEVDED